MGNPQQAANQEVAFETCSVDSELSVLIQGCGTFAKPIHSGVVMEDMEANVVLVDEKGAPIGTAGKLAAHVSGQLHLAFSVFIFNSEGKLLLQQRASDKYHSAGLWTNTCCSHPFPGEPVAEAANRRLMEEMGFNAPLREIFAFTYRAELDRGLTEHEFDHVFVGRYDGDVHPNAEEVSAFRWVTREEVQTDLAAHPQSYTAWFRIVADRVWDSL